MEEQRTPITEAEIATSDRKQQGATARAGAEAKGGVEPQPDDPTDPADEHERADADDRAMASRGFGDHKGARI